MDGSSDLSMAFFHVDLQLFGQKRFFNSLLQESMIAFAGPAFILYQILLECLIAGKIGVHEGRPDMYIFSILIDAFGLACHIDRSGHLGQCKDDTELIRPIVRRDL